MQVQILRIENFESGVGLELSCGKKEAAIYVGKTYINIVCKNASHKAWGGYGKAFNNFEDALKNYKSSEMKAMIQAAQAAVSA